MPAVSVSFESPASSLVSCAENAFIGWDFINEQDKNKNAQRDKLAEEINQAQRDTDQCYKQHTGKSSFHARPFYTCKRKKEKVLQVHSCAGSIVSYYYYHLVSQISVSVTVCVCVCVCVRACVRACV